MGASSLEHGHALPREVRLHRDAWDVANARLVLHFVGPEDCVGVVNTAHRQDRKRSLVRPKGEYPRHPRSDKVRTLHDVAEPLLPIEDQAVRDINCSSHYLMKIRALENQNLLSYRAAG